MAIDKTDLLFKKVFSGTSITDTSKQYFEEAYAGKSSVFGSQIWLEAGAIPTTAPTLSNEATSGVVKYWEKKELALVAGTNEQAYQHDSLKNTIPFNYDPAGTYAFTLYKSDGTTVISLGESNWTFDTETGTLFFHDAEPSAVGSGQLPKISVYQYVGKTLDIEAAGTSGQALRVNSGATGLEWKSHRLMEGSLTVEGDDITFEHDDDKELKIRDTAHNVLGKSLTISSGSTSAGTTNNVGGGSLYLDAGQGKGSAAGGDIFLRTSLSAGSGSSLNALTTIMRVTASTGAAEWFYPLTTKAIAITSTTSPQLKASYDANNYAQFEVSSSGDLEIETVGAGTTDSDITLNADGDIRLDADGGDVFLQDNGALNVGVKFDLANKTQTTYYDSSNYFTTTVVANGSTTLATTDSDGSLGAFIVDADGSIVLDSAIGTITLKDNGSAYTPSASSDAATKSYVDTTQYCTLVTGMSYNLTGGTFCVISLSGATRPLTSFVSSIENAVMIAPFDGSLEKIMFRCEEVAGNPVVIGFHKETTGAEYPSNIPTTTVSIDMSGVADDTSTEFAFTSSNTFSKGDVIGFSIDPANDINDAMFTIVLKYDVTT